MRDIERSARNEKLTSSSLRMTFLAWRCLRPTSFARCFGWPYLHRSQRGRDDPCHRQRYRHDPLASEVAVQRQRDAERLNDQRKAVHRDFRRRRQIQPSGRRTHRGVRAPWLAIGADHKLAVAGAGSILDGARRERSPGGASCSSGDRFDLRGTS